MQAGLVGWEMVCLHTYPPHPGRLSRRYPIVYLLVVILYHARLGSHFSRYPPRLVFTSQASTLCAFGLAPRRVELRAVREVGQGTCSPYNVIYQGNERIARQPERLERGGCERQEGHTREHKAHVRAHLTRQAGSVG